MGVMIIAGIIVLIFVVIGEVKNADKPDTTYRSNSFTCPTCGGSVRIHGDTWECEWCGDSGFMASLR